VAARPHAGSDVCAVVVTHHPDAGLASRLPAIARQVAATVIVDNASSGEETALLRRLAADPSVTLLQNAANLGVARALNDGIRHAASRGFGWVLLFDQDSVVGGDLLEALFSARAAFPEPARVAVVGAGFAQRLQAADREAAACGAAGEAPWEEVEAVITSGSLLPLSAWAGIGPFRDDFFIDYVDIEFCLRARAQGYRIIRTRRALMAHEIGAPSRHRLLWLEKSTTNHSPDRRYYIARNDTVLLREYGRYRCGGWALKSLQRRLRTCKRVLLYETDRRAKIAAVWQGFWHGIHCRMGPRRASAARAAARTEA